MFKSVSRTNPQRTGTDEVEVFDTKERASAPSWMDITQIRSRDLNVVSLHPPHISGDVPESAKTATAVASDDQEQCFGGESEAVAVESESSKERGGNDVPSSHSVLKRTDTVIDELIPRADEEAVSAIQQAVAELVEARREALRHSEEQATQLISIIARRVLSHELKSNPAVIRALVQEGLNSLSSADLVTVRVGKFFDEVKDDLKAAIRQTGVDVCVLVDPSLGAYGCRVETQWGSVDESIDARLSTILEALSLAPPGQLE